MRELAWRSKLQQQGRALMLCAVGGSLMVCMGNSAPRANKTLTAPPARETDQLPPTAAPARAAERLPPAAPAARPACPAAAIGGARGTLYYACDCGPGAEAGCRPGNDAADGRSEATAFRSYEKARATFAQAQAGDMVAFCKGGSFTVGSNTRWYSTRCRADNPCVIRDYAAPWGGSKAPLINQIAAESRAFSFEDGGPSDHDEGYQVLNLALRGPGSGSGLFFYNDVDDVMLCNLTVENFALGVHVAGSNDPANPQSDARNARITLRNSVIQNNTQQGWLGGCDGCAIEYNRFENNGFSAEIFYHNIYLASDDPRDQRVVGNELYRNANIGGKCTAVSLVAHGKARNLLIENNIVREESGAARPQCWGIAIDSGYEDRAESFAGVEIRGNTVINVGNVGIGLNACQDCVVENNVVVHEQPFSAALIAIPDRSRDPDDGPLMRATVRNNSLYIGAKATGTGILLGGEGTGHVAVGNAIHYAGKRSDWSCFDFGLAPASYTRIDYNLCHAGAGATQWARGRGNLSQWRSYSGTSANSSTLDPKYRSVAPGNYDLRASGSDSPMVDKGDPQSSSANVRDDLRRSGAPDIGAYEFVP